MARELGLPWHHQRYVRCFVNGARRGELMEDAQAVDADFIAEWFGPETQGDLFELAPWLEAGEAPGGVTNYSWSALSRYARAGGEQLLQRYRWTWLPRVVENLAAAYQNLFLLTGAASARRGTAYAALRERTKTEE
jgi:hypothetical protein